MPTDPLTCAMPDCNGQIGRHFTDARGDRHFFCFNHVPRIESRRWQHKSYRTVPKVSTNRHSPQSFWGRWEERAERDEIAWDRDHPERVGEW